MIYVIRKHLSVFSTMFLHPPEASQLPVTILKPSILEDTFVDDTHI